MTDRKMKDSGIEWIGEIPEGWKFEKGKYNFVNKKIIPGVNSVNYDRLSLTLKGVLKRSKDDSNGLQPKDFNTYQLLKKDELVFKLIDLQNISTSRVGLSHDIGIVSSAYIILKNRKSIIPSYAEKFYLMMWHRNIFNALGDDGVRSSLSVTDLLNIKITIPPLPEQKSIADFLDEKCGEIDGLTVDIEEQIKILEEYKKSVITEAVTKGLNSNVEMKDSGIECVGTMPKKWEIKKVKYISSFLFKGNGITKEQVFEDGNIQCVRYGEIYTKYNNSFKKTISLTKMNHILSPKHIQYGDILFAGTGELIEEIGKNIVFLGNEPCLAGGDIVVLRHKQNPKFLNYALNSTYSQIQKSKGKAKLKVIHISATDIGNILISIPPIKEQKEIADYLDHKCSEIDSIISSKKQQLETLAEYKKSLIYEYVTGKKEVA
ncbi:restriction endonuclease subunit S [Clostridium sp. C1]|uniref:restriction endonuclease subunit S n=1 Tax=Clostridium sp. C1 TaxID=1155388 RepID=UPI001BA73401|nr:restriction endonuclease subunit S [Clostridium sp. C1]QUN12685.1 restriction endonuclease subunit S [Clostridium sp. C1]